MEPSSEVSYVYFGAVAVEIDAMSTRSIPAQLIQLIALAGPSGSWRKSLTDAIFSSVTASTAHTPELTIRPQMVLENWIRSVRRRRYPRLPGSSTRQGFVPLRSVLGNWN